MSTSENELTEDEVQLLHMRSLGATNERIAHSLDISVSKVSTMWKDIYGKLCVRTKVGAICTAILQGIIDGPDARSPMWALHPGEKKVIPYLLSDMTTEEIAGELNITRHNVNVRLNRMSERFSARSRENLAAILTKNSLAQ